MEREVAELVNSEKAERKRSPHLMCRTSLWGIAGFLGCAYFAAISLQHVLRNELDWPHDAWTGVTYVVWIVLLTLVAFDTHCWRERLFFSVLLVNFLAGFSLTIWSTASPAHVRAARIGTGSLWAVAALLSLTTLARRSSIDGDLG